jgi:hypothetical protein
MLYRSGILALAMLAACAEAGVSNDRQGRPDAPVGVNPTPDAPEQQPQPDAPMQQQPDAACGPTMMEALANPGFDGTPVGTGWTETRIDAASPLVVPATDAGIAAVDGADIVWLGGFAKAAASNKDSLVQTFTVPAGATSLVLSGSWWVSTEELAGTYDTAKVELLTSTGTVIEAAVSISNASPHDAWTTFSKSFASPHAGETVQLRLSSASDDTYRTNFHFDHFSLKATAPAAGCP